MSEKPLSVGPIDPGLAALTRPLALVVAVVAVGVLGYMLLEDWDFFDSLYMVVTTITTVGFEEFQHEQVPFVVVDVNETSLSAAGAEGCLFVQGNAADDEVLLAAGVKRARALVTAVDSDVDNVYVTLSARGLNPSLPIIARAG